MISKYVPKHGHALLVSDSNLWVAIWLDKWISVQGHSKYTALNELKVAIHEQSVLDERFGVPPLSQLSPAPWDLGVRWTKASLIEEQEKPGQFSE